VSGCCADKSIASTHSRTTIKKVRFNSAPDHAPAEVRALWDQMELLCERRSDRDTIEIPEVEILRNNS